MGALDWVGTGALLAKAEVNAPDMDQDLVDVRASLAGDEQAYRKIVERHQAAVARLMWRFSRDRSIHRELVQDVFVEAYFSLRTFQGRSPFRHWLYRVATRVGYRFWRGQDRERSWQRASLEECDEVAFREYQSRSETSPLERVELQLEKLPPRDRLVLTLRFIEGCSVEEVASRTGWTEALVKVQTWRAKAKLRKLMEREADD